MQKIDRYYLEITSIKNLKSKNKPSDKIFLELLDNKNFELNKFFYKQIGKKHHWVDRLVWQDKDDILVQPKKNRDFRMLNKNVVFDQLFKLCTQLCQPYIIFPSSSSSSSFSSFPYLSLLPYSPSFPFLLP